MKQELLELLNTLNDDEIEYLYEFVKNLFTFQDYELDL